VGVSAIWNPLLDVVRISVLHCKKAVAILSAIVTIFGDLALKPSDFRSGTIAGHLVLLLVIHNLSGRQGG
jgi:hypothetical protein